MKNRSSSSSAPDGAYGWVVLACCAICMCSVIGIARIGGLFIIEIIDLYDVNRTEAFLVLVLRRLLSFAFAPLIGKMLTKFDYNVVLCIGSLLLSLSLILTSFTTEYWQILITHGCIYGLSHNFLMSGSTITVGLYFNKRRSLAMGILYSIAGVSGFITPLLFNWLLENYYFHGACLVMGGLTLHSFAFGMLIKKPSWMWHREQAEKEEVKNPLELTARDSNKISETLSKTDTSNGLVNKILSSSNHEISNVINKKEVQALQVTLHQDIKPTPRDSLLLRVLKEIRQDLKLFKDGLFLLQMFNQSFVMISVCYFLAILPDFVEGQMKSQVTKQQVAFVLSMASVGEIVSRFLIGSVLDKLPWAKKHSLGCLSFCLGATILVVQFTKDYTPLMVVSVFFGLWSGMTTVVQRLVEIELMGPKRIHMAHGLTRFVVGVSIVTTGLLIGQPTTFTQQDVVYTGVFNVASPKTYRRLAVLGSRLLIALSVVLLLGLSPMY